MLPTSRTTCRVCPQEVHLEEVFSLGDICISNFLDPDDLDPPAAPLTLAVCPKCSLVQLTDTVPFDYLFRHYWYQSGINETMVTELRDVVLKATARAPVGPTDHVIDIGANDGTLLESYKFFLPHLHPIRMGYEPARNLFKELREHCETAYNDPFPPADHHTSWSYLQGGAKVITAIAMAYDLDDPNHFVAGIKRALHPDGVCIIQFQDLAGMLAANAFDNICHEHLEYYTLHSLQRMLAHNDLVVYDVEHRDINGGSLRCYIGHKDPVPAWVPVISGTERVLAQLEVEDKAGLIDPLDVIHAFTKFNRRVEEVRKQVTAIIDAARAHQGRCDAYGASTKGNTLLQYFGLGHGFIDRIVERSPAKFGKVTAGTRIPIISEEEWRQSSPADVTLVPIWQFRTSITIRESRYVASGGTLVFPLPYVVGITDPKTVEDLAK